MSVAFDDALPSNPALWPAVERAEKVFARVLSVSDGRAERRWSLSRDSRGRPVIEMTVRDGDVAGSKSFTAEEIADTGRVEDRLLRFWGDMLQEKTHRQREKLRRLIAALEV
jgi:hypothetical protein